MLPTNARYQVPVFGDGINYRIVSQTYHDVRIMDSEGNQFVVAPLMLVMVI